MDKKEIKNQIVALSGGKDSTAMLLGIIDRGEKIHSAIFFNTGWEWPEMMEHIEKLKKNINIPIYTIHPRLPFEYWMIFRPVRTKSGPKKGEIYTDGRGWPTPQRRWCTSLKINQLQHYYANVENPVPSVGYAADETHRSCCKLTKETRYPLQEWGMTEADALQYCYDRGYDWGGLYDNRKRVSCYCCPLQKIADLKLLYKEHPDLWANMLRMDALIKDNRGFHNKKTVADLGKRFAEERG